MKAEDWIRVEDRLPEYGEDVLVAGHFNGINEMETWFTHRTADKWVMRDANHFCIYDKNNVITHWMPVVLPKEEKK